MRTLFAPEECWNGGSFESAARQYSRLKVRELAETIVTGLLAAIRLRFRMSGAARPLDHLGICSSIIPIRHCALLSFLPRQRGMRPLRIDPFINRCASYLPSIEPIRSIRHRSHRFSLVERLTLAAGQSRRSIRGDSTRICPVFRD